MITKIISGGQIGADQAAFNVAIKHGIQILNVAGPGASKAPGIHDIVVRVMGEY
jgi:hypothetical protein